MKPFRITFCLPIPLDRRTIQWQQKTFAVQCICVSILYDTCLLFRSCGARRICIHMHFNFYETKFSRVSAYHRHFTAVSCHCIDSYFAGIFSTNPLLLLSVHSLFFSHSFIHSISIEKCQAIFACLCCPLHI